MYLNIFNFIKFVLMCYLMQYKYNYIVVSIYTIKYWKMLKSALRSLVRRQT